MPTVPTTHAAVRALVAEHEIRRMARFLITGGLSFALDFGGLVLLHGEFGWPLKWALLVANAFAGSVHYTLTRLWVFTPEQRQSEAQRVFRYLLLGGFNTVASLCTVLGLVALGADYRLAKIFSVVTLVIFNYFATARFVMQ